MDIVFINMVLKNYYLRSIKYCVIRVGRKGKVRYEAIMENPNPVFMASCEKK